MSRASLEDDPIVGIDLGTTNTCLAVVMDGVPSVIPNRGGYRTTPSVFAIDARGRRLTGHIAKRQALTNPSRTVFAAKRLIGRRWRSAAVAAALEVCPYALVEGPSHDVRIQLGSEIFSVPEVSSTILTELRQVAEGFIGRSVHRCVMTVPAYFNDRQRQATKDAGRIAGLDVVRLINEPTAAALAYGYGRAINRRIAVFDLGGGTFDISLLEINDGVFEVLATAGDTHLGGSDIDERLVEHLAFAFLRHHGVDLRSDRLALQRLRDAAERAKCELSSRRFAQIDLPFLFSAPNGDALHLMHRVERSQLEDLALDLVERCVRICERTLADAGLRPGDIDDVLLVGGQTRTPLVQRRVTDCFRRSPSKTIHADEAVAIGAAIQGAVLHRGRSDLLLLDVTPHDLGIMIVGGYFQTIIARNTTIPTSASHMFTTVRDHQTSVLIVVAQGEAQLAHDNELLGRFTLEGLRDAPRAEVEIEVTFEISADGTVGVSARDAETGNRQSITVSARSGLTEAEVAALRRTAASSMNAPTVR